MKLNHFICPNCGHDFYAEGVCVMCDACNCVFYASDSKTTNKYQIYGYSNVTVVPSSIVTKI